MTGRRDLRVGALQVPPGTTTFPFQRWRGNGHDAGCCVRLAGATEADGRRKEEEKQPIISGEEEIGSFPIKPANR